MKRFLAILALVACLPAAAQTVTATLRVQGDVMVASTGEFVRATDNQALVAGERIMVGEGAVATVRYGSDCSRTYDQPGVYTVQPSICRDNDDRKGDQQQAGNEGDVGSDGGSSLASTLAITLGSVIAAAEVIEHQQDRKADQAISH
jgi:hypothetical protein